MNTANSFRHGLNVGAAASTVLLAALYTLAAPTEDYRARISVLLGAGAISGGLTVFATLASAGAVVLFVTRSLSTGALKGVLLGSFAAEVFLYSWTIHRFVPEFRSWNLRLVTFAVACALCIAAIIVSCNWYRRNLARRDGKARPQ
jgi:hypothetical protein